MSENKVSLYDTYKKLNTEHVLKEILYMSTVILSTQYLLV